MGLLRTELAQRIYTEHRKALAPDAPCALCEEKSLAEFRYWRIIPNLFPYDRIASVHDLLIPKLHCTERDLTDEAKSELLEIKETHCNNHYEYFCEAMHHRKSIPKHFHIHLLVIA